MSRKPCFVAISLLLAAMTVPATFAAPVFHKITVQGAIKTFTYGVSSNNVVVGGYVDQNNVQHGVMIAGSTVTTLDDPNGVGSTICWGVNSSGTVVGYYTNSSGNDQAFMYKNGSFTDIGPAGTITLALGINDSGEYVGEFLDTDGFYKGYLYNGSSFQTLIPPGATQAVAVGINKSGHVTLQWADPTGDVLKSAVFDGTKYTTIDVPGATNTYAHGIDSNDDVVFSWQDTSNSFHGALLMNRTFYKFDDPAGCSNGTYGDGINDHKIIVGACDTSSTTGNGFYVIY